MILLYLRVSTPEQSFERQRATTWDYAGRALDAEPSDIQVLRDKATGRNTDRSGYRELMDTVEAEDITAVVVHSVSRLARSLRDLDAAAEHIVESHGAELHIVSEGMQLTGDDDPFQKAAFQMLSVFAELESEMNRLRVREGIAARQQSDDYWHGPAPLGFEKSDGSLSPAARYDHVCAVLQSVENRTMSKRAAARELDTSRASINRALSDRPELYGL
jgi:DNA invertase Pin-like site-specific DNA recombinase